MSKLRRLRASRGLTLQQVADILRERGHAYRSGRSLVSGWERGASTPPAAVIVDLAEVYSTTSDVVLDAINEARSHDV